MPLLFLIIGYLAVDHATAAKPYLPTCLADWQIEVIAQTPQIRHPSVVACAPDGRVFVAEDPMDISAPSADLALGRILCIYPDGTRTIFADKLHAVFGLQYLDGKLFVLHNPKFSVFTDENGVGTNRVDLIESTNPNPWALNWNDHVPANFKLAMDGFFYVAVGDKGVFGAMGKDGKRVDLHGGGILRLRPNATELEVYCTGVRNILDVAINAEDEILTYDNTDEQQWMSRLTHMVDGGFYGYPYDFIPRQPYTLWMMADYGGGAATGTMAYNEDALPSDYHGDLFLADFGKRQVLRVKVARDGATYKAISRREFFSSVPSSFRPVGIALGPDGKSIYICDWAHTDSKEQVEVGRLLKLSYSGKSQATPKPAWYLDAAMGRPFTARTVELIQGLSHPSQGVRMTAQRRLVERGTQADHRFAAREVTSNLVALIADRRAAAHARSHALWALDGIDGGVAGRHAIMSAVNDDAEVSVRRQAIRQLGLRRVRYARLLIARQLGDNDASIRFQAAAALGRIGDAGSIAPLLEALDQMDSFARFAAFTALNRIGRKIPEAWRAIAKGLESPNSRILEGTTYALRETFEPALVEILIETIQSKFKSPETREAAAKLLTALHHQNPEWKGEWWAYHPVNAPPAAKTREWSSTARILAVLRNGAKDENPRLRLASIEGLREAKDRTALPELRTQFHKESDLELKRSLLKTFGALQDASAIELVKSLIQTRQAELLTDAIAAAEQIGSDEATSVLAGFVASDAPEQTALLRAIEALGNLKAVSSASVIVRHVTAENAEVREASLNALIKLRGESALEKILPLLDVPSAVIRRSAVIALGRLKSKASVPPLLKAYQIAETRADAISALATIRDARAADVYLDGLAEKDAKLRESCRKAVVALRNELLPTVESRLSQLPAEAIPQLQDIYRNHAAAQKSQLFALVAKRLEPADYLAFALQDKGDPVRGRKIFQNPAGVACFKCHKAEGEGLSIGPDLSTIGAQNSRENLAESILYPSKVVREGYQQYTAETKNDETLFGLLKAETPEELVLQDAEGKLYRIRKSALKSRQPSNLSLMPDGMHEALSLDEFADLLAFLESLKGNRALPGNR